MTVITYAAKSAQSTHLPTVGPGNPTHSRRLVRFQAETRSWNIGELSMSSKKGPRCGPFVDDWRARQDYSLTAFAHPFGAVVPMGRRCLRRLRRLRLKP